MLSRWLPVSFEYLQFWRVLCLYVLLAVPVLWLGARSMAGHDPFRKWVVVGLRLDLLLFLVLLIAGARYEREAKDLTVIAVRDTSQSVASVRVAGEKDVSQAISHYLRDQMAGKPPADRMGLVSFDGTARIDALPNTRFREGGGAIREAVAGTDVAQGLQLALAMLPGDTLGRIVLFWDGNATVDDLDAALNIAAARRVPIDVVPLRYDIEHEIAVDRLVAPPARNEREPLTLDVVIRSQNPQPVTAKLTVLDNGLPIDLDSASPGVQASRLISLKPGPNVERVSLPPMPGGAHQWRAYIETAEGQADTLVNNNSAEAVTLVRGGRRILYVDGGEEGSTRPLADTLRRSGLLSNDDLIDANAFPRTPVALQQYDAVVLVNVPKGPGGLDNEQDRMLARYVHELGGGLVMVGGPDTLGAGGWIGSELEQVLPVDCQPPARRVMPAGALVLVIDHSGSMGGGIQGSERNKQEIANEAAVQALQTLLGADRVGVVAFDDAPTWVVPLDENRQPHATARAIRGIRPAGGTNIYPALVEAYAALSAVTPGQAAVKHVLLLTDGQSQSGDYAEILGRMARAKITLSTVGVGEDADGKLLGELARLGRGRFYPVDDPRLLPRVFIKEALTLRNTLIREKTFIPRLRDADSAMISSITALPALHGIVLTWPKQSAQVRIPLVADSGDVVLAHWQAGLGQAAVFTADAGGRWATAWAGSPLFEKFWSQVVRAVARPSDSALADARIIPTGTGRAKIVVEALGGASGFQNFLGATATLLGPNPPARGEVAKAMRLIQVGPGLYETEFDATEPGAYLAMVRLVGSNGEASSVSAAFVADTSRELRDLKSNEAAIGQVAARTGGRVLPPFDRSVSLFERAHLERRSVPSPLMDWLICAALVTLLLDVAARRIAWDRNSLRAAGSALVAYVRSHTQARGGDAGKSLGAWRQIRRSVAERIEEKSAPPSPAGKLQIAGSLDASIADSPAKGPLPVEAEPQAESPPVTEANDTIKRLAEAKRRALRGRH